MHTSAFEILGPIMVGPSSSHTAGALRIALVARSLAPSPVVRADIVCYNSFARTHKGHGTDQALVAGLLGMLPDDVRVRDSLEIARDRNLMVSIVEGPDGVMPHPNTASISMLCASGSTFEVTGESVGGGRIRISSINGVHVEITGDYPTLFVSHYDRPGVLAALTGALSSASVNIATMRTFRQSRGGRAYTVFETDEPVPEELVDTCQERPDIIFASSVSIPGASGVSPDTALALDFATGRELADLCSARNASIADIMRAREAELLGSQEAADAEMEKVLATMKEETHDTIEHPVRSLGGFLFGQAAKAAASSPELLGGALTRATAYAMAVLERSSAMGVIVAAPTAGASGVVPGAVLAAAEELGKDDKEISQALWTSSSIGALIAANASVAGAEGGCQAEVGTASAMAAGALTELLGGTPEEALAAASIAIGNLLGLVCDPVQGLVEYPCQLRNAIGVASAMSAAQLAHAGIKAPLPFDEVVDAMAKVGHALPKELRETALGGLAAEPSALRGCASCGACA